MINYFKYPRLIWFLVGLILGMYTVIAIDFVTK